MGYFSNIYKAELPHRAKTVYMYLKDRSNAQGQCYPAIGTIAKELHLSAHGGTCDSGFDYSRTLKERTTLAGERRQEQSAVYSDRL